MRNKDFISIGGEIHSMFRIKSDTDNREKIAEELAPLGKKFYEYVEHNDAHALLKQICFLEQGMELVRFAVDNIKDIKATKAISIIDDDARCEVTVYNTQDPEERLFMVQDLMAVTGQFIHVGSLQSRRERAGEDLIVKLIQSVGDKVPILLKAGCVYAGDWCLNRDETIERNVKLYERLGFRNVNSVIGSYENSEAMLYCSDELYAKIMETK